MYFSGNSHVMKAYPYDLHVHSCLSPCGDADMTPQNIAGMASLNGLSVVALGLIIWLVILLVKDPKGVIKAALFKKNK